MLSKKIYATTQVNRFVCAESMPYLITMPTPTEMLCENNSSMLIYGSRVKHVKKGLVDRGCGDNECLCCGTIGNSADSMNILSFVLFSKGTRVDEIVG